MKKYLLLFLCASLLALSSFAQDCTDELILQKPGFWKDVSGSSSGIAAADLSREKKVVAAIHTMITSKYSPMSAKLNFGGAYSTPYPNMPANSYQYHIREFDFYCDGNTMKTEEEVDKTFIISANGLDAEIYETAESDRLLGEGYNIIDHMPIEKDGYWYFKEIDGELNRLAWLITYDGKLPFAYVTKKEFLEKRKLALSNLMLSSAAGLKDHLKNIDMEKGFKETEYKNDPEKLKKYMQMDYLPSKERYEKFLANNENDYKSAFDKIESQLQMSAEELNKQAIVKVDPNDHLSYLFIDGEDGSGDILIKPNPDYFNKKLPRSSPQFFWVEVKWNPNDPISSKFKEGIMNAVDFSTLKNMLGK
ncbi:MAG TPA: hypothetical protein VFC67_02135 [Prolixibacteraceae bacterium]|nr:hypothetical protein [Prolixibacteraceae bacterium]